MRLWTAMIMAAALSAAAAPARADDLPPPTVRSSSGAVRKAAPVRHVATRAAPTPRATKALPYRRPANHRDQATLPISGPRTGAAATRSRTYVPPLPGNWVDARPRAAAKSRPKAACAPRKKPVRFNTSVPALPAPTVRGPVAQVAPAPRRLATPANTRTRRSASTPRSRTIVRRATPRRRAVRGGNLTVPCAPGQRAPVAPVRRSLILVCPPGTCDT